MHNDYIKPNNKKSKFICYESLDNFSQQNNKDRQQNFMYNNKDRQQNFMYRSTELARL
ncbi:hypothetical protein ACJX0J_016213, partial [Zea mays]